MIVLLFVVTELTATFFVSMYGVRLMREGNK